jgi:hypothetical protein
MHMIVSAKIEKQEHIPLNRYSSWDIQSKNFEFVIAHIDIRNLQIKVDEVQLLM